MTSADPIPHNLAHCINQVPIQPCHRPLLGWGTEPSAVRHMAHHQMLQEPKAQELLTSAPTPGGANDDDRDM